MRRCRRHQCEAERDRGVVGSVEMMYLLVFCLVAVFFLGYLGRLHAAGVEVTNAAQSAARAASQESSESAARLAARASVSSGPLRTRCARGTEVEMTWAPSSMGTWQGGSVTVEVRCTVVSASLSGVWTPGVRTIAMRDTQPVDRYKR